MSKVVKIGDIASLKTGPFGTQFSAKEYTSEGIPVINVKNIGYGQILENELDYIHESTRDRLSEHILKTGDIVFGRKGSVDRHAYISENYNGWVQGSDCIRLRFQEDVNTRYISHYLKLDHVKKQINHASIGSTMASLNTDILKNIKIILPELSVQNSIEGVLSLLESKVDVNSKICSELEAMAKTLYDYWFVQFDFPDENGKPYRTAGGEMVWNEQLKRKIPKGWNVTTINDMTHSYRGVSYDKKYLLPTAENGILVLRGNNIQNNRLVYDTNVAYVPCSLVSKEQQIRAHDIILTMSSGSKDHIGKCTMFQYDSPHTYGAFLTKFTPDSDKVGFVYLSMISDFFKKKIQAICNGTGINNLTNETFDNLLFPKPGKTILGYFEEIVAPLFEKMGDCDRENEELTKLRDWLLPMLMNGQATVVDAEEDAGKVIPYTPQTVEVRQAARNFGDKETDDTADLVQAYLRRKQHDSKTQKRN